LELKFNNRCLPSLGHDCIHRGSGIEDGKQIGAGKLIGKNARIPQQPWTG